MKKLMILDGFIWLLMIAIVYLFVHFEFSVYWVIGSAVVAFIWLIMFVKKHWKVKRKSTIKTIHLLSEQEEVIKEWYVADEEGLLIGKNFQNQYVDLDLSEAEYAVLISRSHAALNCVNGRWYLEDLGSRNGTGIKPYQSEKVKRLQAEEITQVHPGDRIYIAKTILQIQ